MFKHTETKKDKEILKRVRGMELNTENFSEIQRKFLLNN